MRSAGGDDTDVTVAKLPVIFFADGYKKILVFVFGTYRVKTSRCNADATRCCKGLVKTAESGLT